MHPYAFLALFLVVAVLFPLGLLGVAKPWFQLPAGEPGRGQERHL